MRYERQDEQLISNMFIPEMAEHILTKVNPPTGDGNDRPVQSMELEGVFTVKTVQQYIRNKG